MKRGVLIFLILYFSLTAQARERHIWTSDSVLSGRGLHIINLGLKKLTVRPAS